MIIYLCRRKAAGIYNHGHVWPMSQMPQYGSIVLTVEFPHHQSIDTKYGI